MFKRIMLLVLGCFVLSVFLPEPAGATAVRGSQLLKTGVKKGGSLSPKKARQEAKKARKHKKKHHKKSAKRHGKKHAPHQG